MSNGILLIVVGFLLLFLAVTGRFICLQNFASCFLTGQGCGSASGASGSGPGGVKFNFGSIFGSIGSQFSGLTTIGGEDCPTGMKRDVFGLCVFDVPDFSGGGIFDIPGKGKR